MAKKKYSYIVMSYWRSATLSVVKESVPNLVVRAYWTRFWPTFEWNVAGKGTSATSFCFVLACSVNVNPHNRQNLLEFYKILTVPNPLQRGHCLEIPGYPFRDGLWVIQFRKLKSEYTYQYLYDTAKDLLRQHLVHAPVKLTEWHSGHITISSLSI
jgi:hypothetical protein